MTLSGLQGHFTYCKCFKCNFSHTYVALDYQSVTATDVDSRNVDYLFPYLDFKLNAALGAIVRIRLPVNK